MNNEKFGRPRLILFILLVGVFLVACQPGNNTAGPTSTPTAMPQETTETLVVDPPVIPADTVVTRIIIVQPQNCDRNSDSFDVTPGSDFTITFLANISPVSNGNGFFNIKFRDRYVDEGVVSIIPFEAR